MSVASVSWQDSRRARCCSPILHQGGCPNPGARCQGKAIRRVRSLAEPIYVRFGAERRHTPVMLAALARQSRQATLLFRLHLCWMPGFTGATWWPGVTKRSCDLERGGKAHPSGMPERLGRSLVWLACIWLPREAESRERAAGACNGMSPPTCLVLHCPDQDE